MFLLSFATTPWWSDTFGFGLSGELGWKGQSISATNGEVSMSRFPLLVAAQLLAHIADPSYVTMFAGIQYDFNIGFDTNGIGVSPEFRLESNLGKLAGVGYHHALGSRLTVDGQLRFVKMDYTAYQGGAMGTVAANHFAFLLGVNFVFDSTPPVTL